MTTLAKITLVALVVVMIAHTPAPMHAACPSKWRVLPSFNGNASAASAIATVVLDEFCEFEDMFRLISVKAELRTCNTNGVLATGFDGAVARKKGQKVTVQTNTVSWECNAEVYAWGWGSFRGNMEKSSMCLPLTCPPATLPDGHLSECVPTPIVLDVLGDGFRLTGPEEPVYFDIDGNGSLDLITWTDPDSDEVLLALDRNGNGSIDDGRELFGPHTVQPQPLHEDANGFAALAVFDNVEEGGNEDGLISAADGIWPLLVVWRDANHDGVSQPHELGPLSATRVRAIELDYTTTNRIDRHGNWFRWLSLVHFERGKKIAAADVYFVEVP